MLDTIVPHRAYLINKHQPEIGCTTLNSHDEGDAIGDKILDVPIVVQAGAPVYWNLGPAAGQSCHSAEWIRPLWYERVARIYESKPVLNLAAGACQSYFGEAREIYNDPACSRFVRDIGRFCRLTTVRDRMAEEVNDALGCRVHRLPCASIHAWRRFQLQEHYFRRIALNFMPLGGHYELGGRIDRAAWARTFVDIDRRLKSEGYEPALVAHNKAEWEEAQRILPGRNVFYSPDYRKYFGFYATCAGGILNRVHGAMLLAGRGAPAVAVGNDSRTRMLDELGLPHWHVSEADASVVVSALLERLNDGATGARLRQLEMSSFTRLQALCREALQGSLDA